MARRSPKQSKTTKQIEGQVSLWDIEITKIDVLNAKSDKVLTKTKEDVTEIFNSITNLSNEDLNCKNENLQSNLEITDKQQKFLEKYKIMTSEDLSRVILTCGGGVLIEMINKDLYQTMYLNRDGINECIFNKRIALVPMDKIIYYKDDMKPNELQEEKLLAIQDKVTKVLKRKGDENIIAIAAGKVISINKQGWVLEYKGVQAVYDEEDVKVKTAADEIINEDFKVGESLEVEFNKKIYNGVITRIYNGGDTINCIFDNKHTAFHRSKVRKVKYA